MNSTQLQYHKGNLCLYKSIICQEGYCSGCFIYLEKSQQRDLFITPDKLNDSECFAQSMSRYAHECINVA